METLKKEYKVAVVSDDMVYYLREKTEKTLNELSEIGEIQSVSFASEPGKFYCFIVYYIHSL